MAMSKSKVTKRAKSVKARRTNEERTAETRGRLIDATIAMLYEGGYAATTTISVAERAGVSRGAMMHHFRSRAELLLTVAEHILAEQRRMRVEMLASAGHGLDRFYAAADVSWAVQRHPSTIAFLEIMMATRSDPELRKGMQPLARLIPEMLQQAAQRMAGDLPTKEVGKIQRLLRLHQAALRGLAIELMFSRDEKEIEATRQMLVQYERDFVQQIVEQPGKRKPAPRFYR
jgi:AcrR family transcriptional regulator